MGWPQITWIVVAGFSLGCALSQDGKPKTGNHSFWISLTATGIAVFILSMGGFFSGVGA